MKREKRIWTDPIEGYVVEMLPVEDGGWIARWIFPSGDIQETAVPDEELKDHERFLWNLSFSLEGEDPDGGFGLYQMSI